jgi:hypothetical protein
MEKKTRTSSKKEIVSIDPRVVREIMNAKREVLKALAYR